VLFSSPIFLFGFLPLVLLLYFAARGLSARNAVLLVASLFFYAWGEQTFVLVLLASICANYLLGGRIERGPGRRRWLAAAVAINLGLLAAFKYAAFAVETINHVTGSFGLPAFHVVSVHLPLGISFFTFQALTYVIDVYRGEVRAAPSLLHTALYVSLFPQLIAGPIVRYGLIADELVVRVTRRGDFARGVERFVVGLSKKVLVANHLAVPADAIFALPTSELTGPLAWLGALCYSLQIYFDFSGYSDMAIGLGRMFGLHFPENFAYPYVARSIREFWRRWHITLSTWFRDYLYIPLGGSRYGHLRTTRNLLAVFFLCGLWHGAAWTFVVWGLYHGAFLALERTRLGSALRRAPSILAHGYAAVVVMVGWVVFRADDLSRAAGYLQAMFGGAAGSGTIEHVGLYLTRDVAFWLLVGVVGSTPAASRWAARLQGSAEAEAVGVVFAPLGLALLFVASAAALAAGSYNPFIYFRF